MRNERNIKNNLAYYLISLSNAACALSVIWDNREDGKTIDDKTQCAINFISREIYDRHMALDDFLENERFTEFMSDRDIYELLAARKRVDSVEE